MAIAEKIIIDGVKYNVPVASLNRKADVLDKYAKRTDSGDLKRKIIGVYYNYDMTFGDTLNMTTYHKLYDKLTEPTEYHDITLPADDGDYKFRAYIADVQDELVACDGKRYYFGNLKASFIAKKPARR